MRILRAIRSVNPEGGGPIEGITQVSRVWKALGHETELVSLDAPTDPWVSSCPIPVHALGHGGRNYGYAAPYAPWLRANASRYEAVVISGLWQYHGLGAWRALRHTNTPYFVFPHGMLDPWFKTAYPLKHLKKWLYWPWAEYRVLRDARAVLFTCDEERRLARRSFWLYRCHERVVNYGTSAPEGNAGAQREAFFMKFPGLRGKRLILFVGRIHPKKGCDVLLRGMARFLEEQGASDSRASWHLVFVGPDQAGLQPSLQRESRELGIAERVTFAGMLRGSEKWGALRAADIFVLPSHQENFGIAVVEALACGVPVIVGSGVNIWREIEGDRAGWVCESTPEAVSQALHRWQQLDDSERGLMRERAASCFQSRFEIKAVAQSLLAALRT